MNSFRRCPIVFFLGVFLILLTSIFAYAKKWNVYPTMSRVAIQSVIDRAVDGDVIYFNSGTYDFSDGPMDYATSNSGALQIADKSLALRGTASSILIGAPSVWDEGGQKGIVCFHLMNPSFNKDVVIEGLTMQSFLIGVSAGDSNGGLTGPEYVVYPSLRNLTIKNCVFSDIHRNGVAVAGIQGNVIISDNTISGVATFSRMGIYIDWGYLPGRMEWQPGNTLVTIKNNSIKNYSFGIYMQRASNALVKLNAISTEISPNYQCYGIELFGLKTSATVADNILSNLDAGIDITGITQFISGVSFQIVATNISVKDNDLSSIYGWGIGIWGDVAYSNVVAYNTISQADGLGIYSEGYSNKYTNNIISGYGNAAVYLSAWDDTAGSGWFAFAHDELVKANSVAGFIPNPCHYGLALNTHDNKIIGLLAESNVYYLDWGINNTFKYVYPYVAPTTANTSGVDGLRGQNPIRVSGPQRPSNIQRII